MKIAAWAIVLLASLAVWPDVSWTQDTPSATDKIYAVGELLPVDSTLKVQVGDPAPDFSLPTIDGKTITLAEFRGKKNVVLSFIPAAWTPVCSGQWPGYNIVRDLFDDANTQLIGISADNVPTLYAWVQEMGGVWFPVASDFHPANRLSAALGILRSSGEAERALFLIDRQGVIRYIDVHDINSRPDLGPLVKAMRELK